MTISSAVSILIAAGAFMSVPHVHTHRWRHWLITAVAIGSGIAEPAAAEPYPISGKWTYENAAEKGPSPECSGRTMEFSGERRFDTGGGVPDYRNLTISMENPARWRVVDEFFTGQVRGRIEYTLAQTDPDHLQIRLADREILLRRCQ